MAWENDKLFIDFKQDILSNAQTIKEDLDKGDNILQKKFKSHQAADHVGF